MLVVACADSSSSSSPSHKRRRRQKYPNDGGQTDAQYERILEARRLESRQDIEAYLAERRRRWPSARNVARKRRLIGVKVRRGQELSIAERIMKHQDDSGHKKTPSVLRFLRTPTFDAELVRRVLHREIEQEHSAVLQCFRFILKTDFLSKDMENEVEEKVAVKEMKKVKVKGGDGQLAFDARDFERDEAMLDQEEEDEEQGLECAAILALQRQMHM